MLVWAGSDGPLRQKEPPQGKLTGDLGIPMTTSFSIAQQLDPSRAHVARSLADATQSLLAEGEVTALTAEQFYSMLERPPEAHLGDFALPCFRLAKELKRKPPELAAALKAELEKLNSPWIEKIANLGPFLNFHVQPGTLAATIVPALRDGTFFKLLSHPQVSRPKVMIEYSQPNTHKVFHVGHMRNVALGDCLGRLYAFCGHPLIMANYIGDEGTHIAKCLWYMHKKGAKAPSVHRGAWLGEMYAAANMEIDDAAPELKAQYLTEVSQVLRAIESKQGPTFELWLETRQWSLDEFDEIYAWIGARFDQVFCESEVSEDSQKIVDEFLGTGVFVASEGAIGLDLKDEKLGFVIVRKSDGNTTYATKDLALARRKFSQFNIEKSIYVVASEQNLHFRQVFRTLEKMGFPQAKNCFHLSYGMVVLPDGKMSSRKGNVITFDVLRQKLGEELDKNLEKYRGEWPEAELTAISQKLAVGAIRYGMISSDPARDIVFDLADWLSFEGNTGPYLMYSYARTRSILRKALEQGYATDDAAYESLQSPEERELLRYMSDLNQVVQTSCEQNKPSTLCHHLFDMCKTYNRLLAQIPILKAESAPLRSARLALLDAFSCGLKQGLSLLGIEPPERM